jgi:hypothetical protein
MQEDPPLPTPETHRRVGPIWRAAVTIVMSLINLAVQAALLITFAWSVLAPLIVGMVATLVLALLMVRGSRRALEAAHGGGRFGRGVWLVAVYCSGLSVLTALIMLGWVTRVCPHEQNC